MTILLTEFKPRKTKYGFGTSLGVDNLLDVCSFIKDTIGNPDINVDWYMELKGAGGYGGGGVELKLYVNDIAIYNTLKSSSQVQGIVPKVKKIKVLD
jgi:hypothetical protein